MSKWRFHENRSLPRPPWWAIRLSQQVARLEERLMTQMDDLRRAVERNTSVDESAITLLQGISQQLKDALANNDPKAIQDIINTLDADSDKMAKAVTDNTPSSPDVTE